MKYREADWAEHYSWWRNGPVFTAECDHCNMKVSHPRRGKMMLEIEKHLLRKHLKPSATSTLRKPTNG